MAVGNIGSSSLRRILPCLLVTSLITTVCGASTAPASPAPAAAGSQAASTSKPVATPLGVLTKVVVASTGLAQTTGWETMIAIEQGIFKRNNLDVELFNLPSGTTDATQALASGSVNFASSGPDGMIRGMMQNGPVKLIAAGSTPPHALVAKLSIKSIEEMRGKRIAVSSVGRTGSSLALYELLKANKLGGDKDLELIIAGNTASRLAAIKAGAVDATTVAPPEHISALAEGFHIIGWVSDYSRYPFVGHGVNTKFAADNPAAVLAYVKSIRDSIRFLLDPANRRASVDTLAKYTKQSTQDCDSTYELVIAKNKGLITDGWPTAEQWAPLMSAIEDGDKLPPGSLKPEKFFDDSYLKLLQSSGR